MKESINKIKKYSKNMKIYPGHDISTTLIHEIENKVSEIVKNSLQNGYSYINLKNQIILELNPFINGLTGRRPIILPVIMEVKRQEQN